MAKGLGTLIVWLTADTGKFRKGMHGARQTLMSWKAAALGAAAAGAGAIVAGLGMALREYSKFNDEMVKSLAIMPSVGSAMKKELGQTAIEVSKSALFSSQELAKGYFYLFSAGKDVAQSQRLLGDVAKFAQAGQFDLSQATSLLADSQKALGLSSKDAAQDQQSLVRVSNVLVKANTLANANVQQFAEALQNDAAASMRAFNVELEEGVAVLAAYADQGMKGSEAGSQLGRFLRLLIPSANQNAAEFKKLNIEVFDSAGNLKNVAEIADDMTAAFANMSVSEKSAALETLGFQKRMQQVVFPLLGAGDRIREYEASLRKAGGTTARVAEKQLASVGSQFTLMKNNVKAAVDELFSFEAVTNKVASVMQDLNRYMQTGAMMFEVKSFVVEMKYAFLQTATIASDVVKGIWNIFQTGFKNIVEIGFWFYDNFTKIFSNLWDIAKGMGADLVNLFKGIADNVFRLLSGQDTDWTGIMADLGKNFDRAVKKAKIGTIELESPDYAATFGKILSDISSLDSEKSAELQALWEKAMAGVGKPFEKKVETKATGEKPGGGNQRRAADAKIESPIVEAILRGSVGALRAETTRITKESQIVNNTKRTADGIDKLNGKIDKLGSDEFTMDTEDAFA